MSRWRIYENGIPDDREALFVVWRCRTCGRGLTIYWTRHRALHGVCLDRQCGRFGEVRELMSPIDKLSRGDDL